MIAFAVEHEMYRLVCFVLPLIAATICASGTATIAQPARSRTAAPPDARVFFVDLKDGATVPSRLKIRFGLSGMELAPAGVARANSGHHHLLIDTEVPPLDQPIPSDFN